MGRRFWLTRRHKNDNTKPASITARDIGENEMTKFKVGDRVKLVKEFGGWCGCNLGKEGVIIAKKSEDYEWERAKFDNSVDDIFETDYGNPSHLELLSSTPPATIQHEGYNYTRGEPVVPEWVKDGAWVVEKETGDVMCLSVSKHAVKAINMNGQLKWYGGDKKTASVSFRPFTDADWKWGMWAEYYGEKVFVNDRIDNGVTVSKPSNPYFFIPFSEIIPTTAP